MKILFEVLIICLQGILAEKILFFMPGMPRSSSFTFVPLVHELVDRGHHVTIVNPFGTKRQHANLTQIKIKSIDIQGFMTTFSNLILKPNVTTFEIFKANADLLSNVVNNNLPKLLKELDQEYDFFNKKKFKFDLVICYAMFPNELSFFMPYYFETQSAFYSTMQFSMDFLDEVVGQPHNMAYVPFWCSF